MSEELTGKKVAVLMASGFEQSEFTEPRRALETAGARAVVVSPENETVRGWKEMNWGDEFPVEVSLDSANSDDFDALLLPGGVMNPDKLRQDERAVRFVREFADAGKPIAAICHGPQILIDAEVVRGRRLTSYRALAKDLQNAGAEWLDQPVVTDGGIITSRTPKDIPDFNAKMIEEFSEGIHHSDGTSAVAQQRRSEQSRMASGSLRGE